MTPMIVNCQKGQTFRHDSQMCQESGEGVSHGVNELALVRSHACAARRRELVTSDARAHRGLEGKYRVAAPELMQDTFMSDSEDEGGEVECPIQQQQQYRYMNSEAGTLHRAKPLEDTVTDGHLWPSNNDKKVATIDRQPLDIGFLVSFVVDARGGAMKAKRRGGVRVIVPPAACAAPTRVTCRAATRRAPAAAPPPLMEGEALASRLLELQPQGAKFLAPVIIEVPIYTSSCKEREIVILRSDTGETWQDHYLHNNDNPLIQEALQRSKQEFGGSETVRENGERVTRIVTCDFPHYLACVSRVRQEVHIIGPEGGTISSAHIPQVQAQFPAAALTKRIRVGLQAHAAPSSLTRRVLPRHAAVSPVLTVEPRRRKFHRSITLTAPLPAYQGATEKPSTSNLRLLCSIMGGQARAVWEDVTGSTPLTVTDDCASFTTTVSARFWMMNCQNVSDATKLATELYREMLLVPFEVRIVVLGKRLDALEGRLLVMYITDRYAYETLLQQEHYSEVAHSTSVRFLDSKEVYLEFSGNLVPVTKSGSQPMFTFEAFKDNRVEFTVRVKHHEENPSGRIYFMNEPKVARGEQSQTPACVLDVQLPARIAPRAAKSQLDYLNLDQSGFDALKDELSFNWGGDHNNSLGPASLPYSNDRQLNGHDKIITNGDVKYSTKDSDDGKDTKPHVNGDTLHVDSNKTKATFDSDEDKTPMNTLEKGKKKQEGSVGFLGGLADKVMGVFGHGEEKEAEKEEPEAKEDKEAPPKPQPKPRESKEEKSPPKPAPRLINEDLLGKVDDMFKDLKTKPHLKDDDDPNNQVYTTKLIVDEENRKPVEENLYEQYEMMQPVDTPLYNKKTDPFQFYVGCCEGKYKAGQKHRHDETSNVVDRIEQLHFAAHEKMHDVTDDLHSNMAEGLCIIEEEKDKIKQKAGEATDSLVHDYEKVKFDAQDKVQEAEDAARGKLNDLSDSADKLKEDVNAKVDEAKSDANDAVENVIHNVGIVKDNLNSKAMAMNFAAMERAEELKLRGEDTAADIKEAAGNATENLKNKAQDGANAVSEAVHDAKESASNKAQDIKANAKESLDNAKASANDKLKSMGDSLEGVKEKSKKELKKEAKEAKKKAKEGKNFFTGLVQNIFGEKEKLEDELKNKVAEGKESANEALDKAAAKKDEIKDSVAKKQEELKDGAEALAHSVEEKKNEAEKAVADKKSEIEKSIQDKTAEAKQAVEAKSEEIKASVEGKVSDVKDAVNGAAVAAQEKASEAKDAIQNKASEVGQAIHNKTSEAKEALTETGHAINDQANKIEDAIHDKTSQAKEKASEVGHAINDEANKVAQSLQDKTSEAKEKASEIGQSLQDGTSKVGQSIQDKTSEAKDKASELGHNVGNAIHDTASNIGQDLHDKTNDAKNKANELGNAVHDKLAGFGSAIHETASNVGESVQSKTSEAKDKAKEIGHNIQDEASKVGHSIQDKTSEAKDAIHDKAGEISEDVHEKASGFGHAIKDTFSGIGHAISDTFSGFGHSVHEKSHEAKDSVESTAAELKDAVHEKTEAIDSAIQSKTNELGDAIHSKKEAAQSDLERIRQEAELTTEQIKKSAEDAINSAANKKGELQTNLSNKFDDLQQSGKEQFEYLQQSASDKASDLQRSSKQAFDHVQDSTLSSFDKVESSAKDKVSDAKEKWDEMQSSTRDTFASMRDDMHSLGSSAEDTLHSFQSSAGNTFDSLDDSAKLVLSDTQQNVEESSKQLFGDAKGYFEGFQVSADNKLEEIKGLGKEGVESAEERLGEVAQGVRGAEQAAAEAVAREADSFTSNLNNLGSSVFGSSGKGFMKDSSTKLLESEKSQSSPHKKSSG
ncbi:unnamed protein product [Chrysodeixis includens]|uniref:ZU5 domain-containing protein n=1 Tax=Chrysodeixis includens TaxID=689277 RepID=A0A9N8Q0V0_CHRIL|nr:unnamed protein product [Chrysodeixis includens]